MKIKDRKERKEEEKKHKSRVKSSRSREGII